MESIDYFTISFSAASVIVALISVYLSHFRWGKVHATLSEIHMYHPADGGTAFYVPTYIRNISPMKSMVRKALLSIQKPDGEFVNLMWLRSAVIEPDKSYREFSGAEPFFVEGYSVAHHVFWFWWPEDESSRPFNLSAGNYVFTLYLWTENRKKPSVSATGDLTLSVEHEQMFATRKEAKDATTWIMPFSLSTTIAFVDNNRDEDKWWEQVK